MEPVRGADPLPAWASCLPEPGAAQALFAALAEEAGSVESAVQALSGRSQQGEASDKQQREALLKVHQRLVELAEERGTAYGAAFEAYMLHAGARCGAATGTGNTGNFVAVLQVLAVSGEHQSLPAAGPPWPPAKLTVRRPGAGAAACSRPRPHTLLHPGPHPQAGGGEGSRGRGVGVAWGSGVCDPCAAGSGGAGGAAHHAGTGGLGGGCGTDACAPAQAAHAAAPVRCALLLGNNPSSSAWGHAPACRGWHRLAGWLPRTLPPVPPACSCKACLMLGTGCSYAGWASGGA